MMTYKDGSVYAGEWKKNNMEGIGQFRYANSDFYKGIRLIISVTD